MLETLYSSLGQYSSDEALKRKSAENYVISLLIRGVEDAIIVFLDNIYKYIDKPKTYCRIFFCSFLFSF